MTDHMMTAAEIGEILGVTDRRVRQLAVESGIKASGHAYDFGWLFNYYAATKAAPDGIKRAGAPAMVGWAQVQGSTIGGKSYCPDDAECLVRLFARNGRSRDDAMMAIGRALQTFKK